ncbi:MULTISPECIES: hypothetical protein [Paenibacillus]|uniref:hypothetical protein n=1 Tax=Paenibacillus TaxID=44249 RepID=UPI001180F719|nr:MULTISPECIES: hypothetical protein [Paenibacillus]
MCGVNTAVATLEDPGQFWISDGEESVVNRILRASNGEIQACINKNEWTSYNVADEYSYDPTKNLIGRLE